jgi:hypothetical protein
VNSPWGLDYRWKLQFGRAFTATWRHGLPCLGMAERSDLQALRNILEQATCKRFLLQQQRSAGDYPIFIPPRWERPARRGGSYENLTGGKPCIFNHLIDWNPLPPALRFADRGAFYPFWCRPSRGGIVSAIYHATLFILFVIT